MKFALRRAMGKPFASRKKHRYGVAGRCFWCHTSVTYRRANDPAQATRDHLIPKSDGGGGGANIVMACRRCNNLRGNNPMKLVPWHLQDATRRVGIPRQSEERING